MIVDENTKIYVGNTPIIQVYTGDTMLYASYIPVDYIESTGTQYINTGFVANGGMTVEYEVAYSNRNNMGYIVGSHSTADPYGRNSGYYNGVYANAWELGYGNYYPHASGSINLKQKYQIKFSTVVGHAYLEVDGTTYITDARNTTISDQPVYFFTNSYALAYGDPLTQARLYSCKIYDKDDQLVFDFIPVLNSRGEPGLLDKVSRRFFGNDGTGQFLYRKSTKDVTPVQYIKSDCGKRQYIDTDIIPNQDYSIELKYTLESGTGAGAAIFGSRKNDRTGVFISRYSGGWIGYGSYEQSVSSSLPMTSSNIYHVKWEKNKIYKIENNNPVLICTCTPNTFTSLYNLCIFREGNNTGNYASGKLYFMKIWDEHDNLVRDYIPVLDKEGTPCLYDKVSKICFYNLGDGDFTYEE